MRKNKNQYQGLNHNNPNASSNLVQTFAITSDPQFPWTDNTDRDIPEDNATKERRSEELIREQYNSINEYMNSLSSNVNGNVIINGDMTAFGHGSEWTKIDSLIGILNRPYYFGLGNHDIENNFNNCVNNGCFKNSLNNLVGHIRRHGLLSQFDFSEQDIVTSWGLGARRQGSFAYFVNLGNLCFIQLQHNPTMNKIASPTSTNTQEYRVFPNINWVENQLRRAKDNGQIIIVNVHVRGNIPNDYEQLLQNYGVTAVFSGHIHTSLGTNRCVGNIPAFISGSASQRTYLILEQYTDRLEIYTVRNNDWRNRELVRTIPISTQLPIFSGRYQIVTALNDSSVLDLNNMGNPNNVTLWSNNSGNNQKWDFNLNGPTQAYSIRSVSNPNLVLAWNDYQNSRNVFATPFISGHDEHLWVLERGDIGFIFRNGKNRNLVLDVQNGNTSNGTNIQVHERHSVGSPYRRAQEFQLRKMN
ncbi:hypothetical protein BK744_16145 [Bacillus thuringiensis serovar zhaodongensis]|uniref:metallophosphoesterase n=1 Tax=Bacillus thuringiensis TaxID=1428 RepID=UPI000A383D63|nr:RICIN domain-containing protein [Bacillus thuringiensis]OUB73463.1 hypothetical protein BK744_16145 [Bacillus thuringiensis serovar zhaodongensis]